LAVELVPGKEYTTTVPADLHITQAVLPANAKDTTRSVVSIQFASEEEGEKEKAFAIASLKLDSQDSQALEVVVDDSATITLSVSGKNPVHLSGYYVPDTDGGEDSFYGSDDDEIDSDELGSDDEEEVDEEAATKAIAAQLAKKRQQQQQNGGETKKAKVVAEAAAPAPKQQQQQQKPKQQQEKKQQPQQKTPQAKEYSNGLKVTTTKEGAGAEATKGRRVSVKYVGKLTKNNKVFDQSTKPFTFTLGAREVITGWDLGVAGMKVGEKRTLVIPSELGYGKEGAGREIPPNSSLTFDVELLNVK